jgi:lipoprotein-anchoring transpeptidase ErfK/SrfK
LSSRRLRLWPVLVLVTIAPLLRAQSEEPASADSAAEAASEPATAGEGHPAATVLEAQVELHRRGFSCGSIDGVAGTQTSAALRAFQRSVGMAETGRLDAATKDRLRLAADPLQEHVLEPADLGGIRPAPASWVEKAREPAMAFNSVLEGLAERYHAHPALLRKLNPSVNWAALMPGARVIVPAVVAVAIDGAPEQIVITLAEHSLDVLDEGSRVVAHFPVSIAKIAEKRPVGELHVVVIIPDPDYTFDPAVFTESAEARAIGHKLIIPPGPNNPVGLGWIGLDRPGYGIHGTPEPEHVGRTESHGCFRLANWDIVTLLRLVRPGMRVMVEP